MRCLKISLIFTDENHRGDEIANRYLMCWITFLVDFERSNSLHSILVGKKQSTMKNYSAWFHNIILNRYRNNCDKHSDVNNQSRRDRLRGIPIERITIFPNIENDENGSQGWLVQASGFRCLGTPAGINRFHHYRKRFY